jgi:ABC-2 type transport system permease protein
MSQEYNKGGVNMFDVILWELKQRRKAIFWWTVGSIIMTAVILTLFPSIRDKAAEMNQVINQLPKELRGLKTGGASNVDVGNPAQFLNSQLFYATLPILWIILAITRGASILGREEQSHTLELLLARPIARGKLLVAKAIALFVEFAIVTGVTGLLIVLICPLFELHVKTTSLVLATVYTSVFSLSYGFIAFALQAASALTKRSATAVAVAIGFGGYVLASLSSLTDWLKYPVKVLPYHYFDPLGILNGSHAPRGLLMYLIGTFFLGSIVAYLGFRRRDID